MAELLFQSAWKSLCKSIRSEQGYSPPAIPEARADARPPLCCTQCEQPTLKLLRQTPKPSWDDILFHRDHRCPEWYAELSKDTFSRYLDETYGISYEDWVSERCIESAMAPPSLPSPSACLQLYLPGTHPDAANVLESG
jgi:hypothetical protein